MKVVDRWTTQHGSWDVNPANKWGIDQAHRDKYEAGKYIPPAGADHHIVVHTIPNDAQVHFRTEAGQDVLAGPPVHGWVNFPMSRDAGYNPATGKGPWQVYVSGEMVAKDIGLPDGEHVSTFLVVEKGYDGPMIPEAKDSYLVINGITVWHN